MTVTQVRLALALTGAIAVTPSLAQQRPDSTSPRYTLPALNVTASRDERALLAQPLAVTRVDASQRFGASGVGIDGALRFVPGVLAQSRYGGSDVRLVIRGFGSRGAGDRSNSGTSRGVRVLLDGVPETEPDGRTAFDNLDLGLMRGVEVVRSNASAVWGNAAGGVVSFTTLDLDDPRGGHFEAMGGSYGLRRGILRGDLPLGRGMMAVQGAYTSWDGWRAHSDATRLVVNTSASVPIGERSRLGFTALATDNEFSIPGPLTQAEADSAPQQANAAYAARDERRHNRLARLAASLDQRWNNGMELNASAFVTPKYLQRSERNTFRDFTRYHVGASLVARARTRLGAATHGTFLVGADEAYQDGAILFYNLSPQLGRGDTLRDNKREGANNAGVFAEALLDFGEHWGLTLGARYDAIRYHSESYITPSLNDVKTFSGVTPKVGVTYRLSPTHSIYANAGGGVEAPAGNETDPASTFGQDTVFAINPLMDPVRSTTFEVGTRQVIARDAGFLALVTWDLAVYHTIVRNEIVPYRGGRFYFTAGRAQRSGAELGLVAVARGGLRLDASLALSRNEYSSYTVDSVHYGVPGALADYSGNRIVGVPSAIWALGLGYTLPGRVPFTARAVVEGISSYFADDANAVTVKGHGVMNLSAGMDRPVALGGGVGLRGFVAVNNVLDRRYIASAFLNPDIVGGVPVAFEPGLPRHVVLALGLVRQ